MSLKHKEIQLSHDAKQLRQQITYLKQQLDSKDKELLAQHHEMQSLKLSLNREVKSGQEKDLKMSKLQSSLLDKDRQIIEL